MSKRNILIKTECWNDELSIETLTFKSHTPKRKEKRHIITYDYIEVMHDCLFFSLVVRSFDYFNARIVTQGHMPSTNFALDLKYLFTRKKEAKR